MMRPRIALVVALLSVPSLGMAQADEPVALVRRGIDLANQGRDADSIELFRRAWELGRHPIALGQLGLAEQAVGRWVLAEAHVREVLTHGDDDWVRRNLAALRRAYAVIGQHVGQLEVHCSVAGAHVSVNGAVIGADAVYVEVGTAVVEATADGYEHVRRDVQVAAGPMNREQIEMLPATEPSAAHHEAQESAGPPIAPFAFAGLGVAAAIVGAIIVASNFDTASNAPAGCTTNASPWMCTSAVSVSQVNTSQTLGYVGEGIVATGGVMIIIGAALGLFRHSNHETGPSASAWRIAPTLHGAIAELSF